MATLAFFAGMMFRRVAFAVAIAVVMSGLPVLMGQARRAEAATAPAAPGAAQAVPFDGSADVGWAAAADGGSPVTAYTVVASPGGTTVTTAGTATSVTVTGLTNGTAYSFSVSATNAIGTGPATTTAAVKPGPPSTYRSAVVADAPSVYYRLGEPSGAASAADSSGARRTATYTGATLGQPGALTGDTDTAASFAIGNVVQYKAGTGLPVANADRTIEAWFRTSSESPQAIVSYGTSGTTAARRAELQLANGNRIVFDTNNNNATFDMARTYADNAWHHVAISYVGATKGVTAYFDGQLVGTRTLATTLNTLVDVNGLLIGRQTVCTGCNRFAGALDEVAVYPAALAAERVTAHWQATGYAVPGAPPSVAASGGTNSATISWSAPATNGSAIRRYTVVATSGTTRSNAVVAGPADTTATVYGLAAGVYTFDVFATNQFGDGPSATTTSVTVAGRAATYASAVRSDSPAVYYRLGERGAAPGLADSSGNGRHATHTGATLGRTGAVPGDADTAVFTDQDQGRYQLGAGLPTANADRTVEAWFKTATTDQQSILAWGAASGAAGRRTQLWLQSGYKLVFETYNNNATTTLPRMYNDNSWHHVVMTYTGATRTVATYFDGQPVGSTVLPAALTTDIGVNGLLLGRELDCACSDNSLSFDEVAVYPAALSAARVDAHWVEGTATRPLLPTPPAASAGTNSVTATWAPATATVPDGQQQVTRYRVTAYEDATPRGSVLVGPTATSATITGLKGGVVYTVGVEPRNAFGYGARLTSDAVTPSGGPAPYARTVLDDAPAVYLRLGDAATGNAADSTGNGRDVQASAVASTSGSLVADPDASAGLGDQYLSMVTAPGGVALPAGNAARSVEAWFRFTDPSRVHQLGAWGSTGTRATFSFEVDAKSLKVVTNNDNPSVTLPRTVNDDNWHHAVVTYNGAQLVFYLDGVQVGTAAFAGALVTTSAAFTAGRLLPLDEVAIYPVALTADRVAAHFAASGATRPSAPGSVTAAPRDNGATVTWTPSTAGVPSGNEEVTGYRVTARRDGSPGVATYVPATARSAVLTGLPAGTAYTFDVEGVNAFGRGAATASGAVEITGNATTFAGRVLADAPALYYRMSDLGGASLADSSPNRRDSASTTTPRTSGALVRHPDDAQNLAGQAARYVGPGLPSGNAARSVETWFRVADSNWHDVVQWGTATTRAYFGVRVSNTELEIVTSGDDATFTAPRPLPGKWHHLVVTYDGTTATTYLDGLSLGTATFAGTLVTAAGTELTSGCCAGSVSVDELAVYPAALTAAQVSDHYAESGATRPTAVTGVTARGGVNSLTATWSAATAFAPTGQSAVTGYLVTASQAGVVKAARVADASATSAELASLPAATSYDVDVRALNDHGAGPAVRAASVVAVTGRTATYSDSILVDAPAAYFRMSESRGDLMADAGADGSTGYALRTDRSRADGSIVDDPDEAVRLSLATDRFVAVPGRPLPVGNEARTLEAWIKTTSTGTQTVLGYGKSSVARGAFNLSVRSGNQLGVVTGGTTDDRWLTLPVRYDDNAWHHLAATFNGTTFVAYFDGVRAGTASFTAALNTRRSGLRSGSPSSFVGALDELAVFPAVLSDERVAAHRQIGQRTPDAPTITSVAAGHGKLTPTWSDGSANGSPITGHVVRAALRSSGTVVQTVTCGATCTSATLTGLVNGEGYYVQVAAVSANGTGVFASHAGTPRPDLVQGLPPGPDGPTVIPSTGLRLTAHATWGPEGSPYLLNGQVWVENGVSLTILPGTVVKSGLDGGGLMVEGQLVAVGTAAKPVVFTSQRDDTVGGDSNGDAAATSPAMGDWAAIEFNQVDPSTEPMSVLDNVEVRYGGGTCVTNDAVVDVEDHWGRQTGRVLISNSKFVRNTAGVASVSSGAATGPPTMTGVYNSYFYENMCDLLPGDDFDAVGNVLLSPISVGLNFNGHDRVRIEYNDVYGDVDNFGFDAPAGNENVSLRLNNLWGNATEFSDDSFLGYGTSLAFNHWRHRLGEELHRCYADEPGPVLHEWVKCGDDPNKSLAVGYDKRYDVLPDLDRPVGIRVQAAIGVGSRPVSGPVDLATGALTYEVEDLSVNDAGRTLGIRRSYLSTRRSGSGSGDLGSGWSTNFADVVTVEESGASVVTLTDDTDMYFDEAGSGGLGVAAGMTAAQGVGATLRAADLSEQVFDAAGLLRSVTLRGKDHKIDIDRSGPALDKVTGVSGRAFTFSRNDGRLATLTDTAGRAMTYGYDGGRLATASRVGTAGEESYGYDAAGRLVSVTTPMGRVVLTATYDADGRVATYSEAGSGSYRITYDTENRTVVVRQPDGHDVTYVYDEYRRMVSRGVSSGRTAHVVYGAGPGPVAVIEGVPARGVSAAPRVDATVFDSRGRPFRVFDPLGGVTRHEYDEQDRLERTIYPDGTPVTYGYDAAQRLTSVIDGRGNPWSATYDDMGLLRKVTDPLGRSRDNTYQPNGDPLTTSDVGGLVTTYETDDVGRISRIEDPLQHATTIGYTAWGAVSTVTNPRGAVTQSTFNGDRQVVTLTRPARTGVTTRTYDAAGRPRTVTDAAGGVTTFGYDAMNRVDVVTDARGEVWRRTYTADGDIETETDPELGVTTTRYTNTGSVASKTDATGVVTAFTYDAAGHVLSRKVGAQTAELWQYDANGRRVSATTARGGVTTYTYDANSNVTRVNDTVRGVLAENTYDAVGRLATTIGVTGNKVVYGYDASDRIESVKDDVGIVTLHDYDDGGRLTSASTAVGTTAYTYDLDDALKTVTDPEGRLTTYVVDLGGRVEKVVDPAQFETSYTYDDLDRPKRADHPDATHETWSYDGNGNVKTHLDRVGSVFEMDYDGANRLIDERGPLGYLVHHDYDLAGRPTATTDADGVVTGTKYDTSGRVDYTFDTHGARWQNTYTVDDLPSVTTDPDGVAMEHTYDGAGRVKSNKDATFHTTTFTYDGGDRLLTETDPLGRVRKWEYDKRGRLAALENGAVHGSLRERVEYTYDAADRLRSRKLQPSANEWVYTYDESGLIESAADPIIGAGGVRPNTVRYGYDARGLLDRLTLPNGGVWTFTYDAAGRRRTQKPPAVSAGGVTTPLKPTTYDWDGEGRLKSTTYGSGRVVTEDRDALGRVRTATDADGNVRGYTYSLAGRIKSASAPGATPVSFGYDARGLLTSRTDQFGAASYGYTLAHRPSVRTLPGGTSTTTEYDSRGLPLRMTGAITRTYAHDDAGQLTRIGFSSSTADAWDDEARTYDGAGRLTSSVVTTGSTVRYRNTRTFNTDGLVSSQLQEVPGEAASVSSTYGYDPAGRLASATDTAASGVVTTTGYGWDADSNLVRLDRTVGSGTPVTETWSYDAADRLVGKSTGDSYGYDDDSNLVSAAEDGSTATYGYNGFNELVAANASAGTVGYGRDGLGRIQSRTAASGPTSFGYEGPSTEFAEHATGPLVTGVLRGANGAVEGSVRGTSVTHALTNGRHDITASFSDTSTTDAVLDTFTTYDPFGNAARSGPGAAATGALALGFQADFTDSITGLVDMGARQYSPALRRFTSIDSIVGTMTDPATTNRFLYGNANPLTYWDPTGHWGLGDVWDKLKEIAAPVVDWVKDAWDSGKEVAGDAGDWLADKAGAAVEKVQSWAKKADTAVRPYLNRKTIGTMALRIGAAVAVGAVCASTALVGCLVVGGVVGALDTAVFGCPPGQSKAKCAAVGAVSGMATGGVLRGLSSVGALGGRPLATALLTGGATQATTGAGAEYLATGRVTLGHTAEQFALGAAVGGAFHAAPWVGRNVTRAKPTGRTVSDAVTAAEALPRGLSPLGGIIDETGTNAAGGRIFTSTGAIMQNDFKGIVNSGLVRGDEIHILTGAHGAPDGSLIADASLFADDVDWFGEIPGVHVYDLPSMSAAEIRDVLSGPGTIIGGFCDSGVCLSPFTE